MSPHSSEHGKEASRDAFNTTRWSLLMRARGEGSVAGRALNELCTIYRNPIYHYVRRRGYQASDADDLVQGFFARVLAGDLFGKADREKGKLRAFLLKCLKDHLVTEYKKAAAKKKGGGVEHVSLDLPDDEHRFREPSDNRTPEEDFDIEWAILLLRRARNSVRKHYKQLEKAKLFDALSPYLIDTLDGETKDRLASKFGLTENNIRQILHRMKAEFDAEFAREIYETVSSAEDAEEELAAIRSVLQGALLRLR